MQKSRAQVNLPNSNDMRTSNDFGESEKSSKKNFGNFLTAQIKYMKEKISCNVLEAHIEQKQSLDRENENDNLAILFTFNETAYKRMKNRRR